MLNKDKLLNWLPLLTITILGAFLRFMRLNVPNEIYFDEVYYVKAAKEYLNFIPDTNWMHPPIAKMMIALGIGIFGDNSFGWRMAGAVLGTLSIYLIYLLAQRLFKSRFAASCAAFLLAICPLNIVASRIALLDIYVSFFTLLGFYLLYLYLDLENNPKTYLILSIISFAFSFACKWCGIFGIIGALIILAYYKYKEHKVKDNFALILFLFFILTALVYLASFIPFFVQKHGFAKFITYHVNSIKFHYEPAFKHVYLSRVWTWPLLIRPIWFYFKDFSPEKYIGIICMGNPFIWWSFIPFYFYIIFDFIKTKKPELFFIICGYFSLYAFWFIALKGGFFYYMAPASIFMYLTITYVLNKLWENNQKYLAVIYLYLVSVFFVLFLPVIIALPVTKKYFYKLMWLKSWI